MTNDELIYLWRKCGFPILIKKTIISNLRTLITNYENIVRVKEIYFNIQ